MKNPQTELADFKIEVKNKKYNCWLKENNFTMPFNIIYQKMKKKDKVLRKLTDFWIWVKKLCNFPVQTENCYYPLSKLWAMSFVNNTIRSTILECDANSSEFKWTQQPYAKLVDGEWASLTLSLKLKAPSGAVQVRVCDVLPWGLECVKVTKIPEPLRSYT